MFPKFLALTLLLLSVSVEASFSKQGDLLYFSYNTGGVIYDLESESVMGTITGLGPDFEVHEGSIYEVTYKTIFEYRPPEYARSEWLTGEASIAGFGFAEGILWVGYREGRITGYEPESLQVVAEHKLPAFISRFAVGPAGDFFVARDTQVQRLVENAEGALVVQASTTAPSSVFHLEAGDPPLLYSGGLHFSSADLSFVAGTGDAPSPRVSDGIISRQACGLLKHNFEGGPPEVYNDSETNGAFYDFAYIDQGELVGLHFYHIVNEPNYHPSRLPVVGPSDEGASLLEHPLSLRDFTYHSLAADGEDIVYFYGPDAAGRATVNAWSISEQRMIVSAVFPCGIRGAAYSKVSGRYYVYDTWGRIYTLELEPEPALVYLNTLNTVSSGSSWSVAVSDLGIELRQGNKVFTFDFNGHYRGFSAAVDEAGCANSIPSVNVHDCERYAEIEPIPYLYRAVVDWVGEQLVTLSQDYRLRFWGPDGLAIAEYAAPYDNMVAVGGSLLLLRATQDGSEVLAIDPSNMPDSDADGVDDLADNCIHNPNASQSDLDLDGEGDACDIDRDGDFLPDAVELELGLNPSDPADASADIDGDGFSNLQEYALGSNPTLQSSVPPVDVEYFEGFADGLPLRFFSQGERRWLPTRAAHTGAGLRSADTTNSAADSSLVFFLNTEREQALHMIVGGSPLLSVTINGEPAQGLATDVVKGGWLQMVFRVPPGVSRVELQAAGSLISPRAFSSPLFHYSTIDNITVGIDRDGDLTPDSIDLCPLLKFDLGSMVDVDGDGMGHLCDEDDGRFDVQRDSDGDGHPDFADVCPEVSDESQLDSDGDLLGNACDADDDNDGFDDAFELLHGSSPVEKQESLSLVDYFPTSPGVYRYRDPTGAGFTTTIEHLSTNRFRATDSDGFITLYDAGRQGFSFTHLGEKDELVELGKLTYMPPFWNSTESFVHSSEIPEIGLLHRASLVNFHIIDYGDEQRSAFTFLMEQKLNDEWVTTEETYVKGVGLYQSDQFLLVSVEPLPTPAAPSKKKGGAVGGLWLLLTLCMYRFSKRDLTKSS